MRCEKHSDQEWLKGQSSTIIAFLQQKLRNFKQDVIRQEWCSANCGSKSMLWMPSSRELGVPRCPPCSFPFRSRSHL